MYAHSPKALTAKPNKSAYPDSLSLTKVPSGTSSIHLATKNRINTLVPGRLSSMSGGYTLAPVSEENADLHVAMDEAGENEHHPAGNAESLMPEEPLIRQQLSRILQSPLFIHSERLSLFLQFVVEHAIRGDQDILKEYLIGSEVYHRRPPYNPSEDSIVRTEARRLRGKIKQYYGSAGKDDPVCIHLRPGSYAPTFHYNLPKIEAQSETERRPSPSSDRGPVVGIGIFPFLDIQNTPLSAKYACGIPDELAYTLMRHEGCRVKSPTSMDCLNVQSNDRATAIEKAGVQIAVEGCVQIEGKHIRITARIVDASGFQLWARRFKTETDTQIAFVFQETIAASISSAVGNLVQVTRLPSSTPIFPVMGNQ